MGEASDLPAYVSHYVACDDSHCMGVPYSDQGWWTKLKW